MALQSAKHCRGVCTSTWLICVLAAAVLHFAHAARNLAQTDAQPADADVVQVWHVTVGNRAPDCFQRDVFLVNGTFQPELVVTQGQTLQVMFGMFARKCLVARSKDARSQSPKRTADSNSSACLDFTQLCTAEPSTNLGIQQHATVLQVTIFNDIPEDFPSIAGGISIHWHGFSMRTYEWFDGTGRITQCPVLPGQNFTYRFEVSRHLLAH